MLTFNLKNRLRRKVMGIHGKLFLSSYLGDALECNICRNTFRKMIDLHDGYTIRGQYSDHSLKNTICPNCGSWFRHRMLMQYINEHNVLANGQQLLHFAPESFFVPIFHELLGDGYHTCDLKVMDSPNHHIVDITDIPFEDGKFDRIICSHVLEHIEDDRMAIAELYRILRTGGIALIAVPTYGRSTEEDLALSPKERKLQYGINIHVRLYGTDISRKLEEAGFSVTAESFDTIPGNYLDRSQSSAHMDSDKYLFVCSK
jgi:SAM-dependent methyltransferase